MDSGYQIADVAKRTGFSASTLRYYEDIGLLPTPARTGAGYRLYDDHAISRLRFIARAKRLGCTLEEITDLVRAWEGDDCAPVSQRLRMLVDAKLVETSDRITELMAFTHELRRAAAYLGSGASDGPCDDECVCLTTDEGALATPVPVACTLVPDQMPQRLEDWQRVLSFVTTREDLEGGLRLTFGPSLDVAELARLVGAEQGCCQFFSFALTIDTRGTALEVRAPTAAQDIVTALFAPTA